MAEMRAWVCVCVGGGGDLFPTTVFSAGAHGKKLTLMSGNAVDHGGER
jgi:hypothetical protein